MLEMGSHPSHCRLVRWYGFHSNLFRSCHHRGGGGLWGWNGILIADWPGSGTVTSVPSFVGFGDLPSRHLSGSALPTLAICPPAVDGGGPRGKRPPPWQSRARVYADCREGPELRAASTGREPHAIPGVTLPLSVILTAHRLCASLHSPRQTASGCGDQGHCRWFVR